MTIDELQIERLALDELSPSEEAALRARIQAAGGPSTEQRLAELQSSNAAILAAHPPERAAAVIQRRLADAKTRRSSWWMVGPAIAATAVVLLIIRNQDPIDVADRDFPTIENPTERHSGGISSDIRLKGSRPHLVLYRQTSDEGEGAERLHAGQEVAAGDVLQVSYIAAGATAGVILSIDGRGVTTLHYPATESAPPSTLEQGAAIPLSNAYELDDAPTFERFFFVTSQGPPLDIEVVLRAARSLANAPSRARDAPLPLPLGYEQDAFLLRKSEFAGASQ